MRLYHGQASTFPNGCHVCEVEVDPDTGKVEIVAYHVLDDFGRVINPMLVAGQVHGGVVQGLGQALLENMVYDESTGQLLTASFTDYAMPRAADMPDIDFEYEEIPCVTNALGAKGCGEAGTVGAIAGGDERHRRRARRAAYRHAGDAGARVARAAREEGSGVRYCEVGAVAAGADVAAVVAGAAAVAGVAADA